MSEVANIPPSVFLPTTGRERSLATGQIAPTVENSVDKKPPEWAERFLASLDENLGNKVAAARETGIAWSTFYDTEMQSNAFARAIDDVKRRSDSMLSGMLEHVSVTEAMKPENKIERFFQLKALMPHKYREKTIDQPTAIHVTFGYEIPTAPTFGEIPATAQVQGNQDVK